MSVLECTVPPASRRPFKSVGLTDPARRRLQSLSLRLSALADQRLSMSLALIAALDVAEAHQAEVDARALELAGMDNEGDDDD